MTPASGPDPPAQKKVPDGDEFVALGEQLIDGRERAVDARFIDIMDKDDCAVIASVQNVPADGVGVMVLPVLRVDDQLISGACAAFRTVWFAFP